MENEEEFIRKYSPALKIYLESLDKRSQKSYLDKWKPYEKFRESHRDLSERELLIIYFREQKEKYKTSSLWSFFSEINKFIQMTQGKKIQELAPELIILLKNWQKKDITKKSDVFSRENIDSYLHIPDIGRLILLRNKIALLFGVFGLLRGSELIEITDP